MEKALRERLLANSTISGAIAARLYPEKLPQECEYPAAIYTVNEAPPTDCDDGGGFTSAEVVYVFLSAKKVDVVNLGNAAVAQLDRWHGTLAGETIDWVSYRDKKDGYDEELRLFYRIVEFTVIV